MKKVHFTHNYLLNPYHPLTVYVIGAGGTGSQVVTALARIDCSLRTLGHKGLHVTVFDDDIVTPANLGRQLFTPMEIGCNKADVLVTRVNRFFGLGWDSKPCRYPSKGADDTANIIISCVDNAKARIKIGKNLRTYHNIEGDDEKDFFYWIDFGNTADTGQVVLGTIKELEQPKSKESKPVGKLPCIDELFDLSLVNEKDSGPSCSLAEALEKQDLFINSTLANLGCNLLWNLITSGGIEFNGLFLNLRNMKVNPINL